MAVTTVQSLLDKAGTIINDRTNIRWDTTELLGWLNESYQQIVLLRPDSNAITAMLALTDNTPLQSIPTDGVALIGVTRNQTGEVVMRADKKILDEQFPTWYAATPSATILHYVHDKGTPREFYVYPQPLSATVEVIYSAVPTAHALATDTIKLDDRFAPAILDYMIYRSYQKDADYAENAQRSATAYQTFLNSLGVTNATPAAQ